MNQADGFRHAFEHASDGMLIAGHDGRLVAANRRACALLGHAQDALVGRDEASLIQLEASLLMTAAGELVPVALSRQALPEGGTLTIITAPAQPDADCESLRSLVNALPSPAFIMDRGYKVTTCNEAFARALGRPIEDVLGANCLKFLPPELAAERAARIAEVFASGEPFTFSDHNRQRWFRNQLYPVKRGASVEQVAVFAIDVTEMRAAEDERRASEERLRATLDGRPDVAVQWYDRQGRVLLWNHASEAMFGFRAEEAMGKRLVELIHTPEQQAEFSEMLAQIEATQTPIGPVELAFQRRDRSTGTCLSTIFAIPGDTAGPYFVCMDVDLTEHRRVEAELRQAQKEEVLGRLAGAMAHDFNNLLTAIVGFAELGAARVPRGSEPAECFEFVLQSAQRGATLTGNLLAFARKKVIAPRSVQPRLVVDRLLPLMRPLIGEHIEIVTEHDSGPEHVTIDIGSLEQVLMNLVVNARDAMPSGGRLTITSAAVSLGENERTAVAANKIVAVPAGRYLRLQVGDSGEGLPSELYVQVFEPFFTTKSVGQGTGIGLATCAGIMRQAGGYIGLASGPSGTTFEVHLPVTAPHGARAAVREVAAPPRGDETVLLVDDEPSVRVLMQRVLRSMGYTVLVASEGREALAVAARHEGPVHLLLTDLVMPEMGGLELADALKLVRPETKVLLCSGYADDPELIARNHALLAKPYTPAVLGRRVREILDS